MQKVKIKKSKFIINAEYEPLKAQLFLTFKNGKTYAFKGIDYITVEKLKTKKKPAKFFKKNILGTYIAKKVK